ncbi:MAG: Panacea domain-containing protein [Solirubrobacterales bacterium]
MNSMTKLRELIVYLAQRSADDPRFGRVKLAKLLFFCDFGAYAEFGEPITDACYRKKPHGPLADEELLALRDLKDSGAIDIEEVGVYMYKQKRIVARRDPDISWLTPNQHTLVDEVVKRHWEDDATNLSNLSHTFPGWGLASLNEVIPYHTVFISREAPTQADVDWAEGIVRERQLA